MSKRIRRLLACVLWGIVVAPAIGEAQTVSQLTLAGSGLPPGPLDVTANNNPMPNGIFTHRFNFPLSGLSQIPNNAVIQEVRLVRISSGTFSPGVIPAGMRPLISNSVDTKQVVNGAAGPSGDFPDSSDPLEIYGSNAYVTGGTATFTSNPFTAQAWTRADLDTFVVGFWARWRNTTGQDQIPQRFSMNDYAVEVVHEQLTVTGPATIWSFNGANPVGWSTSVTLTSSRDSSTSWSIISGADKVSLSTTTGGQVAVSSSPAGFSTTVGDIVIRATWGSETADHVLTERTPRSLQVSAADVTVADPTWAYESRLEYRIVDQFSTALPSVALPINEQWTTAVVDDYPKHNWRRGSEGSLTIPAASDSRFVDRIQGETSARRPTPVFDPNSIVAVYHWGQAWQIGSLSIGSGRRVQTNVLLKRIGRALHTNIVSPP